MSSQRKKAGEVGEGLDCIKGLHNVPGQNPVFALDMINLVFFAPALKMCYEMSSLPLAHLFV